MKYCEIKNINSSENKNIEYFEGRVENVNGFSICNVLFRQKKMKHIIFRNIKSCFHIEIRKIFAKLPLFAIDGDTACSMTL